MKQILSLALACLTATPALSDTIADYVTISVLPGWRTDAGTHMTALQIDLAPGWKTYWRAPGDAGIPPVFDWTGSENVTGAAYYWPVPQVFYTNGMRTIGYADQLVLPIELGLSDVSAPVQVQGHVMLGICEDICMPAEVWFSADLPPTGQRDTAVVAALVSQPLSAAQADVGRVTCSISPIADGLEVTAQITLPPVGSSEAVVIEAGDPEVWVSEATSERVGDTLTASADLVHVTGAPFVLDRSALRLTIIGSGQAVDIRGCTAG